MPRLIDDELFGKRPDSRVVDPDLIEGGLRSKQFATVVDLLGYGEIQGFVDPNSQNTDYRENIFLDNTPLQNANGDQNFQDVEVFFRNGSDDQTSLGTIDTFGPDRIENTTPVGVPVTKSASVSRLIRGVQDTDGNELIKIIRVTIQIPALQNFQSDGDITGTEVKISIRITENDGTVHNPVVENSINGKATSPFVKDYEIDLESSNLQFPLTVTVIRNTDDSTVSTLVNKTNFLSFTTIITESQSYQGFAYVALRFNAQSFQSFPKRMYRVKGTKIKIPHNGTVDVDNGAISYSGTFNGTFKTDKEWSADPAWILYDLLTTDKGFGGPDGVVSEDSLDVFSFFQASKYASEIITDPITGITEPRFSCNVILNQKNDAYTVINDLCSVMNAMPFYSVGTLQIGQDRPTNTDTNTSDAEYLFTNANVTESGFSYTGTSQRTKFTEVEVAYFDNDTQKIDYELVTASDVTALSSFPSKYGRTRKTIKAFACTSRGQANRLGRWFLYTNLRETEVCSFTTTLEAGVIVRPSMIIGIADSLRAGVRRGGRINTGVSTTQIIVDDANNTDLTTENAATLSVVLPDGTMETRSISDISDKTITVSSAFSAVPQANSIWAIENTSVEFQTYRVISIEESSQTEYTVSAIIHDPDKYSQVEANIAAQPRNITTLLDVTPSPSNPSAIEQIVVLNNRAVSKIFVSWEPIKGVKEYRVESQFENDSVEVFRVSRPDFELFESRLGSYIFKIKSYNSLGILSTSTTTVGIEAVGKTAVPADVQNLVIEPVNEDFVRLRFDKSTDVDVIHGGNVVVRHSNLTDGTGTFTNSVDLIPALSGNISETLIPAVAGEVILKFRDDGGRLSAGESSVIVSPPETQPTLLAFADREDTDTTPFSGAKTNVFYDSTLGGLTLGSTTTIDSVADIDSLSQINILGNVSSSGVYEFASPLDLGSRMDLKLIRHFVTESFIGNSLIDARTGFIDTWDDIDALTAFSTNATLLVATTSQDPSLSTSGVYTINDGSGGAGSIITISKTGHGYSVGSFVVVNFTSGTGVDDNYEIISKTNDTFTLTSATLLNTSGSCTYGAEFSSFNTFANGTHRGRGFKFKVNLFSSDPAQTILLKQLGYNATLNRRVETVNSVIASGGSTKAISFVNSFFTGFSGTSVAADAALPTIGIVIENAQSGDFFSLPSISSTGFSIDIKNGSSFVNRNFKYTAVGFGRGS